MCGGGFLAPSQKCQKNSISLDLEPLFAHHILLRDGVVSQDTDKDVIICILLMEFSAVVPKLFGTGIKPLFLSFSSSFFWGVEITFLSFC